MFKKMALTALVLCLKVTSSFGCYGTDKLVGVITDKSHPGMHVRWCTVRLILPHSMSNPFDRPNIVGDDHVRVTHRSEATFQCEAEVIYNKLQIGTEVVGEVNWQPGMISRDGSRMECLPSFKLTGVVSQLNDLADQ